MHGSSPWRTRRTLSRACPRCMHDAAWQDYSVGPPWPVVGARTTVVAAGIKILITTCKTPGVDDRGHPSQGMLTPRRRAVGRTRQNPSQPSHLRSTSLYPMAVRPHGRGLTQAAWPAPSACRPSHAQPHVACMGVETIASRAVISLYQLIQRYGKRHGLHRPREVGRRAAGRCASGGRAAIGGHHQQHGKGVTAVTANLDHSTK